MLPASRWRRPGFRCRLSKRWPATIGLRACSTAFPVGRTTISRTATDRIDAVLTHKLWGTLIFIVAMVVLFSSIFVVAVPIMDLIDDVDDALGD